MARRTRELAQSEQGQPQPYNRVLLPPAGHQCSPRTNLCFAFSFSLSVNLLTLHGTALSMSTSLAQYSTAATKHVCPWLGDSTTAGQSPCGAARRATARLASTVARKTKRASSVEVHAASRCGKIWSCDPQRIHLRAFDPGTAKEILSAPIRSKSKSAAALSRCK